jgi:iron complex outermembrane receptor protein
LNVSYQNGGNFRDFVEGNILSIAPSISYQLGDSTLLTFEYNYLESNQTNDEGLPIDPVIFELPKERFSGKPDDFIDTTTHSFYLTLDHRFNENISLRSGFVAEISDGSFSAFRLGDFVPETNEFSRFFSESSDFGNNYAWQTDLISKFKTGSIEHQLLAGFELARSNFGNSGVGFFDEEAEISLPINVFAPEYGTPILDTNEFFDRNYWDASPVLLERL